MHSLWPTASIFIILDWVIAVISNLVLSATIIFRSTKIYKLPSTTAQIHFVSSPGLRWACSFGSQMEALLRGESLSASWQLRSFHALYHFLHSLSPFLSSKSNFSSWIHSHASWLYVIMDWLSMNTWILPPGVLPQIYSLSHRHENCHYHWLCRWLWLSGSLAPFGWWCLPSMHHYWECLCGQTQMDIIIILSLGSYFQWWRQSCWCSWCHGVCRRDRSSSGRTRGTKHYNDSWSEIRSYIIIKLSHF